MIRSQDRQRRFRIAGGVAVVALVGLLLLAWELIPPGDSGAVLVGNRPGLGTPAAGPGPVEFDGIPSAGEAEAGAGSEERSKGIREAVAAPVARLAAKLIGVDPDHRSEIEWKLLRMVEVSVDLSSQGEGSNEPWDPNRFGFSSAGSIRITNGVDGTSILTMTEAIRQSTTPLAESADDRLVFEAGELLASSTEGVVLVLEAVHPLYSFDPGKAEVSVGQLEDLRAGIPLGLACRVDAVGLCALRGSVAFAEVEGPSTGSSLPGSPVRNPAGTPVDSGSSTSDPGSFGLGGGVRIRSRIRSAESAQAPEGSTSEGTPTVQDPAPDISRVRVNFRSGPGDFDFTRPRVRMALFPLVNGALIPRAVAEESLGSRSEFRFVVEEPGPYVLAAFPNPESGLIAETVHVVLARAHEEVLDTPLLLRPGAEIEGTVDAPLGMALEGHAVSATLEVEEDDELVSGGAAAGHIWNGVRFEPARADTETDGAGRFRLASLGPGAYWVHVESRGVVDLRSSNARALDAQRVLAPQGGVRLRLGGRSAHIRFEFWPADPAGTDPQSRLAVRHGQGGGLLAEMVHPVTRPLGLLVDPGVPLVLELQSALFEAEPLRIEAAADGAWTEHRLDVRYLGD